MHESATIQAHSLLVQPVFLIVLFGLLFPGFPLLGQPTLAKEYIYIDGRVIAIESPTTSGAAPPIASEVTVTGLSGGMVNAILNATFRKGSADIGQIGIATGDPYSVFDQCYINVTQPNAFEVTYLGAVFQGTPTAAQNHRCVIDAGRSRILYASDGNVSVTAYLSFKPRYEDANGTKTKPIYVWAVGHDGQISSWQYRGFFTLAPEEQNGPSGRILMSVGPESGTGSRTYENWGGMPGAPAFNATYEQPAGDFNQVQLLFGTVGGQYNCQLIAIPGAKLVSLLSDDGSGPVGYLDLNVSANNKLENSSCSVRRSNQGKGTKVIFESGNATVQFVVAFKPGFHCGGSGCSPVPVYQLSFDGNWQQWGWSYRGEWLPQPPNEPAGTEALYPPI